MAGAQRARRPSKTVAAKWHEAILIHSTKGAKRLRNWYHIDILRTKDTDDFTWGYSGSGPHETSYSILRQFFGKEVAWAHHRDFVECYISKLDPDKGFEIDSDEAARILSEVLCSSRQAKLVKCPEVLG